MSVFKSFAPGQFCWIDLMTPDPEASRAFYTELFGWGASDNPIDGGGNYTQFTCRGHAVAGMGAQPPEMKAAGVPAIWNSYIAVDDVDAVAAEASKLGAQLTMPPMQVMEAGRMAVLQDPTGAAISLWQAGQHHGAGLCNEPTSLSWNELLTDDVEAAKTFYGKLLGWTYQKVDGAAGDYWLVLNGPGMNGGIMQKPGDMGAAPPAWTAYVAVEDCDATLARAESLGGKRITPNMDIPYGRFAVMSDPQGGLLLVIKLAETQ